MPIKGILQKFGKVIGMPDRDPRMDQIEAEDLGLSKGTNTRWSDTQKRAFLKNRPYWQPNRQTFRGPAGGKQGGAGSGSFWGDKDYSVQDSTFIRPALIKDRSYNTAFKEARQRGDSTFMFNGQLKHTRLGNNPENIAAGERMREQFIIPSDSVYLHDVTTRTSQDPIKNKNDTILIPGNSIEELLITKQALEKKKLGGSINKSTDKGPNPYVVDIEKETKSNKNYRTTLWTGKYMQMTVMSIPPGEDIGLEMHKDHDQFIRIEEGKGIVQMGDAEDNLTFQEKVEDDFAIIIPAGKWHNMVNTGKQPLKLYSIYSPVEHPKNTVHKTKQGELTKHYSGGTLESIRRIISNINKQ